MSGFSREVRVDTIGTTAREIALEADAAERAELAGRFGIASLDALTGTVSIKAQGEQFRATGRLSARLVQSCVATNVPLAATIDAPFAIAFRKEVPNANANEVELSEDECDVVFYDGGAIDLGEAMAETLALAIDPYPRAHDADAVLKDLGVLSEAQAGPFAALAKLKLKLSSGP